MKIRFTSSIFPRFLLIAVLSGLALGLSLTTNRQSEQSSLSKHQDIASTIQEIDREVDTLLVQYKIEKSWCKKKTFSIPGTNLERIEKRILIPPEVIPVQLNHDLNLMAKRYGGSAIGSENTKENSVTIHIKVEGYIVETIILKTTRDLKREPEKKQTRKI